MNKMQIRNMQQNHARVATRSLIILRGMEGLIKSAERVDRFTGVTIIQRTV